jgi:hypothetical protein
MKTADKPTIDSSLVHCRASHCHGKFISATGALAKRLVAEPLFLKAVGSSTPDS